MASGVTVDPEVDTAFTDIKIGHKYRYVMFKMTNNDRQIGVDCTVENSTYEEFLTALPRDDGRYVVYDYQFTLEDGGKREKLLFIHWVPDNCSPRSRMLYASSKDAIKKRLRGVVEVQASDISEVSEDVIREKVKAGDAK